MQYRAIFLGQKPIGEKCFDFLFNNCKDSIEICGIVSNSSPDVWWKTNKIRTKANELGIPFIENERRNSSRISELTRRTKADLIICVQHPWILSPEILRAVNYFAYNLHNAKLPDYKGSNTCNHAILNKERTYTCTMHYLADEVDMGDICYEETFPVTPDDTAKSLYERSYITGQKLFLQLVTDLKNNRLPPKNKIKGAGNFYSRNSIENLKEISDLSNEDEIDLKSRAFFFPFFEKASCKIGGVRYYVIPEYTEIDHLNFIDVI